MYRDAEEVFSADAVKPGMTEADSRGVTMKNRSIIQNSIISDMSEGVMAIQFDGTIELVNDAAVAILERERDEYALRILRRSGTGICD